ncbi:MAG: LysM peptidoglycan-binding domain-containing protein [Gammaproteobacteria bacterium]
MLKKIILISLFMGVSVIGFADTVEVKSDHPQSYVVQQGDTLWGISGKFLQHPWLWPQVWEANPQIDNPHLIYPGDVVSLQYKDGRPILSVARAVKDKSGRYVKLSPTVRSYEKEEAIPTIPIDAIKQFLFRPLVVTDEEMDDWPYVVASYDEHLVAGAGNKIYVRGLPEDASDKRYAVYRKGKPYVNYRKDKDLILGYEALHVADAIIEKPGDPASAIIARSSREVLSGDRLAVESEEDVSANFIPTRPSQEVNANVISVIDGVSQIGQYQVVVLDVGANQGVEVGNVLGVYQSGKTVTDYVASKAKEKEEDERRIKMQYEDVSPVDSAVSAIANDVRDTKRAFDRTDLVGYMGRPGSQPEEVELPDEYAGVVMVFRTFENISYALVMETVSAIHVEDAVKNL